MKLKFVLSAILFSFGFVLYAQDGPYDIKADVQQQVSAAVTTAKAGNKHVVVIIGANWCKWCRAFDKFIKEDRRIDSLLKADFVVVKLNYDKKNEKCIAQMKAFGYPQRFGIPVFIILSSDGTQLHTQNSAYLEAGNETVGYNSEKVFEFFYQWRPAALDPKSY
jgi:thiol:disulfide interchange protein